jgi:Holliday junction DNA helicase RuvB
MIESNAPDVTDKVRDTAPEPVQDEQVFEAGLRPQSLDDFIGQEELKNGLRIFMQAAKERSEPLEHVLLYGNPGLGKTTLANIIAREMGASIRVTSGPAIERVGDLAAVLSNLQEGDVLFIDEIHRINKTVEEILYPAMEDYALDLVVGKGPSARALRLALEKFTVIGATTRLSMLSSPLRDRFGIVYHFDFYTDEEIGRIIGRSGRLLGMELDEPTCLTVARRARRTPRIANRLLKRARDYAQVKHAGAMSSKVAHEALDMLAIDPLGLDAADRIILNTIINLFSGGPVGLSTLAAATQEEMSTIEEVYEPYLMQLGFLERTPRGRVATRKAYAHLDLDTPDDLA